MRDNEENARWVSFLRVRSGEKELKNQGEGEGREGEGGGRDG